ncbi:V-type ATP synthase subunit C [Methanolobus profundi]|uniref:A-type ATP synthase subunit C n=1 Tax=Methanolobus profundi TaxID=487685 RepID=A0A1I4NGH7_9EURY|nr:V-type ATP synthase subunit C [Methanolobus profundi]SFM14601.1 V/A-type H+-transporting ATPase subunit C [Methanolobus profundi]
MQLLQKFKRGNKKSQPKGHANYAYTTARVRAMKSKILPKETYPRLMNMSIDEITRFIEESEYKQDVDELARQYEGVDLIEHALNKNLAVTFTKLLSISEGDVNFLVGEQLKKYDIWSIKTILRGKYCNASTEEILDAIVAAGRLSYTFLSDLASKATYEEVISELANTEYYPILKNYDGTNLSDIENQLDKMYYAGLFGAIEESKSKDRKLFAEFTRMGIDLKNLITLFRLKRSGITDPEMMDLMIDGGLKLKRKDIEKMITLSLADFVSELEKSPYWDVIADVADPEMVSLIGVESQLKKHRLKSAASFSHVYPISIVPIMDYMLSKKNEVNNLRIIIRGKAANLDDETIKEQLVI